MSKLASTIRNNLDTLAEEYDQRLREIEGYAELPNQVRLDAAQYALNLMTTCLEGEDDVEFIQFIRAMVSERLERGLATESLLPALTALEEILMSLVTAVDDATFLWRAFSRAHTVVSHRDAEVLREFELKFRQIIDRSPVGIFRTTPEGQILEANPAFLRIVGYDSLEAINQVGVSSLYQDPADREYLLGLLQQGPIPDFETRFRRADGQMITVSINVRLIYDGEGSPQFLEGIIEDITERKQTEERVRRSQKTLQMFLDSMPFGVVIIGKDKKVRRANNAALALMGYVSEEQIIGGVCHRTLCPAEAGQCPILDFGKELDRSERILVTKGGRHIPILKSVVPITLHGEDVLLEAFVDITERKQAEETLRESEERYRDLFENANDLIQSVAPGGSFLYVNRAWRETLGYGEEEISNLSAFDIIHPDSRAHCIEVFQRVMAGESFDRVEAMFVTKDGRTITVEGSINSNFEDGIPVATRGIFRDITERKRAEAERERFIAETQVRLRVSQALAGAQTEEDVLDAMIQVADFYPQAQVLIFTFDPTADELTAVVRRSESFDSGMVASTPIGMRLTATQFTLLQHISPDAPFVSPNFLLDERIDLATREQISKGESVSFALLPVMAGNEWLGFIAASSREEGYFDEHKLHLYQTMADQGAAALQAARLRDALSLIQFTVDEGPDAVFWIRPDATLAYVNDTACEMLGYSRKELLSLKIFDFDPNFPREIWSDHWQEAKKRQSFSIETQHKTKSGQFIPVEVVVSYLEYGGQEYHCAFARDVTERKQAGEALLRLERSVEQSIDGIAVADMDGNIQFVNSAWAQMHGYSTEELLGRPLSIFHTEEQLQKDVIPFNERVMEVDAHQGEVGHVRKDGTTFPTWMTTTLLKDEKGNPVGLVGTARDITESKRLEKTQAHFSHLHSQFSGLLTNLLSPGPLTAKLQRVTDWIVEYMGADFCRIWIIQEGDLCDECMHARIMEDDRHICLYKDRCLHLKTSSGRYTHIDGEVHRRVPFGAYKIGRVAAGDDPKFLTNDAQNDPRIHNLEWARELGLVSFAGYRLSTPEGEILGVLALFSQQVISPEEDAFLESVASATSLVIHTAALEEESIRLAEAREVELRQIAQRRAEEVQTSTEVAQEIAAAPALDELFRRVVTLIKERFSYYHAQIFRYEPATGDVALVIGYGEAGEKMLAEGHRLKMGRGVVGTAAATGQPILAADVTQDPDWVSNPHLPETKGELAVPIILRRAHGEMREQVLGILDVQSDRAGALTEEDQLLLEGLCGQIAIAIESTRLRQEMEESLHELERLYRATSREGWGTFQREAGPIGYLFDQTDVIPADDFWTPEVGLAMERRALVSPTSGGRPMAVTPLSVHGEVIGALGVQDDPRHPLSRDDLALVESVSEQVALALESARLFDQTQAALAQTDALYKGSDRVVRATTLDDILQALIHSTTLQRLDRVSIAFFNRPWEDEMPEEATILATWERSGGESRSPVGTRYSLAQFPAIEAVTRDEPAIFRDITTDERVYEILRALLLHRLGMRSLVLWPLVVGGQWIGFLTGQAATALEINEDEIRQITSLVDQAAAVIQNIRLFEQTQATLAETEALYRASRAIGEATSIQEIVHGAAEVGASLYLSACSLTLITVTDEEGVPVQGDIYSALITDDELIPIAPIPGFPMTDRLAAHRLLEESEFVLIYTDAEDPQAAIPDQVRETMRNMGMRGMVTAGLSVRGQPLGFLSLSSATPLTDFPPEHARRVRTVADQVAVAVESWRLFEETKANLEEITLLHRRYLQEAWDGFLQEEVVKERTGYMYDRAGISPASDIWRPEMGLAVQRGAPIALPDMADTLQETVEEVGAILHASPTQSALAVPLKVRGQTIGALDFYETDQKRDWSTEDIAMVEAVASQVALAIENARAYEEIQKRAEELREMDRLKTQFLANMSHELRTPLNSIIGFSRVILKGIDGPINEQQRADLTSIYNNGQHLLGLINDILDISRIEAGKIELIFEPVDLQHIIDGVMSTTVGLVKDKPINLQREVDPELAPIRADGTRVRQVILNLLSNAAKFTEEGEITLRAWTDEEQVTISVEDTGIGIPLEHQVNIFEEFRQVDASTTRRTGGVGLGLAITRHFVEMHGGRIWVESEPGIGSTFTFTLPTAGPVPVIEPELADLAIDFSRKLILAVEDDAGAISIYKRYLEKHGYQIVGLNQGEQAVRWALELSPYAIILDVILPDKDGWTVLEELKSSRETRQIPVIICSINKNEEARGLSLGASAYLAKPILEQDLLQALKRLEEHQRV